MYAVRLIKPDYYVDENKTIRIKGYIDEQDNYYNEVKELLDTITRDTKIYCYMYQLIVAEVERYANESDFRIPAINGLTYYTGSNRKANLLSTVHCLTNRSEYATPTTVNAKMFYNGYEIRFLDVMKWMDRINQFTITPEEQHTLYNTLMAIETIIIDKEYLPVYEKKHWGRCPVSLASLSRKVLNPPTMLKNKERDSFLLRIKGAYNSGYNYIANTKTYDHLYYYDVKSMYPFVLLNRTYPHPASVPIHADGFVEKPLAIYHVAYIRAKVKPQHFPTIFCQKEQQSRMGISNNTDIDWLRDNDLEGWITSVDYRMLLRDYDIEDLEIDETYFYTRVSAGSYLFGTKMKDYFNKKEASTSPLERQAYKLVLNTFSGSLGMILRNKYRVDNLTTPNLVVPLDRKSDGLNPWDLAAFMTAYAREYITSIALQAGFNNVKCISTDAVVVRKPEPILSLVGNELGDLSLEKEMWNVHWWRPNAYEWQDAEGNWHGKANGLPSYKYEHGKLTYAIPKILYDPFEHCYKREIQKYNITEE